MNLFFENFLFEIFYGSSPKCSKFRKYRSEFWIIRRFKGISARFFFRKSEILLEWNSRWSWHLWKWEGFQFRWLKIKGISEIMFFADKSTLKIEMRRIHMLYENVYRWECVWNAFIHEMSWIGFWGCCVWGFVNWIWISGFRF